MGSTSNKRYITTIRGLLFYVRAIPKDVQELDARSSPIRESLKSKDWDIAMSRRDAMADRDDRYWRAIRATSKTAQSHKELQVAGEILSEVIGNEPISLELPSLPKGPAGLAFHDNIAAQGAEILSGPDDGLQERLSAWLGTLPDDIAENYRRMLQNADRIGPLIAKMDNPEQFIKASMGVYNEPVDDRLKVSEVLPIFLDLKSGHMSGMSDGQRDNYIAPKDRALRKFISVVGDIPVEGITIDQAGKFASYYTDLVYNREQIGRATPIKHVQNLQFIFKKLNKAKGWNKPNPFDALDMKDLFPEPPKQSVHHRVEERATFPTAVIREKWLQGEGLTKMNEELRHVLYALVETGCNPLELLHLTEEKICLDHPTPHILIQPSTLEDKPNKPKTNARVRAVPLVGIALEVVKQHPNGFHRYYDKSTGFSNAANTRLKQLELRPDDVTVYSLRHEYIARMRTGKVPKHLRRAISGHKGGDANDKGSDVHDDYGIVPSHQDFDKKLAELARYMALIALPFDLNVL